MSDLPEGVQSQRHPQTPSHQLPPTHGGRGFCHDQVSLLFLQTHHWSTPNLKQTTPTHTNTLIRHCATFLSFHLRALSLNFSRRKRSFDYLCNRTFSPGLSMKISQKLSFRFLWNSAQSFNTHLKVLLRVLQLDKHIEKQSKRLFQNNGKTIVFFQHQNAGKFQNIIMYMAVSNSFHLRYAMIICQNICPPGLQRGRSLP